MVSIKEPTWHSNSSDFIITPDQACLNFSHTLEICDRFKETQTSAVKVALKKQLSPLLQRLVCHHGYRAGGVLSFQQLWNIGFFSPCSSDELFAYLTHCRPDLCILEGKEEEGEADRDEEEFVLIEDNEEEEDAEEDEGLLRHRSSGDDWEVSGFIHVLVESRKILNKIR